MYTLILRTSTKYWLILNMDNYVYHVYDIAKVGRLEALL